MNQYLFTSQRLGFRVWIHSDVSAMAELNADAEVMRYFPSTYDRAQTAAFIQKMIRMQDEYGYCYYAVDRLADAQFIGFIGLAHQSYQAEFTPCTDIGWRLARQYWGKGYATEGAKACITYASDVLGIPAIYAVASKVNTPSINVMKKAGMSFCYEFTHSLLTDTPTLAPCVLYKHENSINN